MRDAKGSKDAKACGGRRKRIAEWGLLAGLLLVLGGCGQFFPPLTNNSGSGSGSGSGNSTVGNYLYVANAGSGLNSIAGFSLASGKLSTTSGATYTVPASPSCVAVTPSGSFLYAGSAAGAIYVYTINSDGSLTIGNSGSPVASGIFPGWLRVDTTGNWLIGLDALTGEAYVFSINTSTGALTAVSGSTVVLQSTATYGMALTPNDSYVYVALGTGGVETLSFNSSTGALAQVNGLVSPKQNLDGDNAVAVSPNGNFLFVGETGINAVRVYSIGSGGVVNEISGSPYSTGLGPDAILVDATGSYVYVANGTANTISAFSLGTTGALTQITGSPFAAGTTPWALAEDKSDTYLAVVDKGGSPDLKVYTFSTATPGALTAFATSATGTDPTAAISIAATQ
jgi:6-phosphogluconolactonase (cycloisomerase 2 family)